MEQPTAAPQNKAVPAKEKKLYGAAAANAAKKAARLSAEAAAEPETKERKQSISPFGEDL